MNTLISLCIGVGLSTSTGFRILVPFACLSAAALYGDITLPPEMAWLNSYPALIGLVIGTLIEVAAYYIPWVNDGCLRYCRATGLCDCRDLPDRCFCR